MTRSTRSPRIDFRIAAAAVALASGTIFACSEITALDESGTFRGPVTTVAGGTGWSYVTLDRAGAPTEVGVAFTEGALTGLPAATVEFVFELPEQAKETPYKHFVINWQPVGHAMPPVYAVPHFDIHFYTITNAEREAMTTTGDPEFTAKMARLPAAGFIPAGYLAEGMAVARMGKHWRDPSSPELNGQPFTATLIYGSYDGAFIFDEPMVTTAYLQTKPAVVTPIKLPAEYPTAGYRPTSYSVGWDAAAKEYRIAMSDLVQR